MQSKVSEEFTREVFEISDDLSLEVVTGKTKDGPKTSARLVGRRQVERVFGQPYWSTVEIRVPFGTDPDDIVGLDNLISALASLSERVMSQLKGDTDER